jgi:hypothetical protein
MRYGTTESEGRAMRKGIEETEEEENKEFIGGL